MKKLAALGLISLAFASNATAMNGDKTKRRPANPADMHKAAQAAMNGHNCHTCPSVIEDRYCNSCTSNEYIDIEDLLFFLSGNKPHGKVVHPLPEASFHCNTFEEFRRVAKQLNSEKTTSITLSHFEGLANISKTFDGYSIRINDQTYHMPENVVFMQIIG